MAATPIVAPLAAAHLGAGSPQFPTGKHALFDYHSGFWVNLQHFLYEEASVEAASEEPRRIKPEVAEDQAAFATLTPKELKDWKESVEYYKSKMIERDLLFDRDMVRMKDRREGADHGAELQNSELDGDFLAALRRAAPLYRAQWWAKHERANRAWIASVSPLVEEYGQKLSEEIAAAYDTTWPAEPIRVDIVAYAGWSGAYTSPYPTRVTIASEDEPNQKLAALEVIFHESSHALIQNVGDRITHECEAQKVTLPKAGRWHAVLFFTAGYYVQQLQADYTPYADQNGLWTRAWPMYRSPLAKDWQPHLQGKRSLDDAIAQLVRCGGPRIGGQSESYAVRNQKPQGDTQGHAQFVCKSGIDFDARSDHTTEYADPDGRTWGSWGRTPSTFS